MDKRLISSLIFISFYLFIFSNLWSQIKKNDIFTLIKPLSKGSVVLDKWTLNDIISNKNNEFVLILKNKKSNKELVVHIRKKEDLLPCYEKTKNYDILFEQKDFLEGTETPQETNEVMAYLSQLIRENDTDNKSVLKEYPYPTHKNNSNNPNFLYLIISFSFLFLVFLLLYIIRNRKKKISS